MKPETIAQRDARIARHHRAGRDSGIQELAGIVHELEAMERRLAHWLDKYPKDCVKLTVRRLPVALGFEQSVTDLYRDLETVWWVLSRGAGNITANSMIEWACPEQFPEHALAVAALDARVKVAA